MMTAVEFLTVLCYIRDKRDEQERRNKMWALKN